MKPPRGQDEIRKLYGDPRPFVKDDGTISPIWEARMTTLEMPTPLPLGWDKSQYATRVRINQAIVDVLKDVFAELEFSGLWARLKTYDGGYTWRMQRGGTKISMHGYGGAVDFDAKWNGLGAEPQMDRDVVSVFEHNGWTWGGRWKRPDGMHFQFGRGY